MKIELSSTESVSTVSCWCCRVWHLVERPSIDSFFVGETLNDLAVSCERWRCLESSATATSHMFVKLFVTLLWRSWCHRQSLGLRVDNSLLFIRPHCRRLWHQVSHKASIVLVTLLSIEKSQVWTDQRSSTLRLVVAYLVGDSSLTGFSFDPFLLVQEIAIFQSIDSSSFTFQWRNCRVCEFL